MLHFLYFGALRAPKYFEFYAVCMACIEGLDGIWELGGCGSGLRQHGVFRGLGLYDLRQLWDWSALAINTPKYEFECHYLPKGGRAEPPQAT